MIKPSPTVLSLTELGLGRYESLLGNTVGVIKDGNLVSIYCKATLVELEGVNCLTFGDNSDVVYLKMGGTTYKVYNDILARCDIVYELLCNSVESSI